MEGFVEFLKERGSVPDIGTSVAFWLTGGVFLIERQRTPRFPYNKWYLRKIQDFQVDELKVAAREHKYVVFLFFLFGAATHAINCVLPKYQYETNIVLLRFVTKCCWFIVSYLVLLKIRLVLRSKRLEKTLKMGANKN